MARQAHSPIPFCAMIIKRNKMPETSITLCQNALVEQSVILGSSHVPPPALPDPLSCLWWCQTQPFRSGTSHLPFWVGMGRPSVPFCWEVKQQLSSQGQKAEHELAGNFSPVALHEPVQKQPGAKWKHPGQLQPSARSPRPLHFSTAWLSTKMKCKLAICGLREGNVTFMGDDSPGGKPFLQGCEGQACRVIQTLSRSRLLGLAFAACTCPWRFLWTRWGTNQAGGGHRGYLPKGLPRCLAELILDSVDSFQRFK